MNFTIVRYSVKEGRASENRTLVEKVFADLQRTAPDHLRYLVFDLGEGSFLHIAATSGGRDTTLLTGGAAFKAFSADHAERRQGELSRSQATLIGNYRMLAD